MCARTVSELTSGQRLVPTDGSDGAAIACGHAADPAQTHDATLHVLDVADTRVHGATRVGGAVVEALEVLGQEIVMAAAAAAERSVLTLTEVPLNGETERFSPTPTRKEWIASSWRPEVEPAWGDHSSVAWP